MRVGGFDSPESVPRVGIRSLQSKLCGDAPGYSLFPSTTNASALLFQFVECSDFLEICGLVGTVSPAGAHLHCSLGRADGSVLAGHVVSLTVQTTAEVVLGEAEQLQFGREVDMRTGFRELVVRQREP